MNHQILMKMFDLSVCLHPSSEIAATTVRSFVPLIRCIVRSVIELSFLESRSGRVRVYTGFMIKVRKRRDQ